MESYSFELPALNYSSDAIATEGFLRDFIKNVFPFGNINESTRAEALVKFKDMLTDPKNLFGSMPETLGFYPMVRPASIDKKRGVIIIKGISFNNLFRQISNLYGEKRLDLIFYRTYDAKDIRRFKAKQIRRGQMKITALVSPLFFALELAILFSQLYKVYKNPKYRQIAKILYNESWLSESDNRKADDVDLNYAMRLLDSKYQLKPHQIEFIKAYPKWKAQLNLRGVYNAFDQGLGKTLTAMSLAMALHIEKIYVICPNTLVANWYNEIHDYYNGRIVAHDCKNGKAPSNCQVFITNNESIKNIYPYLDKSCKSMLIVDEGHNFRNLNSVRVKELIYVRETLNPSDVLPMSGTPLKATPNELVPALLLLDPLFTPVAAEMYNKCFNFDNYQAMEIVTARLGKMIYRKMKSDVLELPDKEISDLPVVVQDPTPYLMVTIREDVMREYAEIFPSVISTNKNILDEFINAVETYSIAGKLETKWYIQKICKASQVLKNESIESLHEIDSVKVFSFIDDYIMTNPATPQYVRRNIKIWESKLIHFEQVAMGRAIGKIYPSRRTEMYSKMWAENEKMFLEKIRENPKKTVIFSQFYGVVSFITERLNKNDIPVVTINGKVSTRDRARILNEFKNDDEIRVIVATSQSMGTGVTLVEASQMFFFGPPWRSADYDQCCDRIYRIGQDTDVHIYNVILETPTVNLSSRMEKILKWSSEMFHGAIDSTVVAEE